ncbi:PREDICTED: uncharacterized protein LOC108619664 isoform X1 [Drosophila arizonae]|uniref:Uncharacterized protein LOC108619664 isoform X1 n=1 Tax=Drosophila arizonae TaxID=7263 RepID=A0ABM1PXA7_DROAR|nr:PREDICTED: uncharacterized protein LOC108619664 isoform X1 [Drosophila arizonae]
MCKLSLFLLLAIFGCLVADSLAGVTRDADVHRDIVVVKDVRDFVAQHPGLKLQRMVKQPAARATTRSLSVRYTLGYRLSGDRLVAQGADVFHYQARKDVSLQITYPESGAGSIVTFVELICTQDNNEGNAYVVAGGIGQRFISIVLEAKQTNDFAYQAQYFGSD